MRRDRYSKAVSHATLNYIFAGLDESYPDYAKRQRKKYNRSLRTNATIKHPGGCPNGRSKCRLCSIKNYKGKNSGKRGSDTWKKLLD